MKRDSLNVYEPYGLFIQGQWVAAASGETREVIDPSSNEVIGLIPVAGLKDIEDAIGSCRAALGAWKTTSPWARSRILRQASVLIRERSETLAKLMSLETGKPVAQSLGELSDAADQFEWYAGETMRIYGQTVEARLPDVRCQVIFEPVGVVAALSAWNFPALLPARKIAAGLAAGCTVVVKPASEAPGTCMAIIQALHDAELPHGVVALLTGDSNAISKALIASPHIAKVSFTGSTQVGRNLMRLAADGLKKLSLELGGHAPVLVFEDADVQHAAQLCARFKFRNCGQVCASPSRFYVHESIYNRFCQIFAQTAAQLKVGPGTDPSSEVGPMANARGLQHAKALIQDAQAHGAKLLTGGDRPASIPGDKGFFISPTVLADVPAKASIMQLEPFAPVAPIASFSTFEEAIALANSTPYGLASYVFTQSLKCATEASEQIKAGMVAINDLAIAAAELPFGGRGDSGMGREGGALGIREYLEPKTIRTKLV